MKWIEEYSRFIEPAMAAFLPPTKKPSEVYGVIWDILRRGGKRVRPILVLLSCEAVGGKREDALQTAVAIEFFHNFTLIHDDIEDNSKLRRGEPCLHIRWGVPLALNAGDGLFMMVFHTLMHQNLPPKKSIVLTRKLVEVFTRVLEGQGMEINWERENRWDVDENDYYTMVQGKTASLIAGSCWAGGFIGGAKKKYLDALWNFGISAGILFQIKDDLLNIVGDEAKYKKEIGGDINEGKRTLLSLYALSHLPPNESQELQRIHEKRGATTEEITRAITLIKKSGAIQYVERIIDARYREAQEELRKLPPSHARDKLFELLNFFAHREM